MNLGQQRFIDRAIIRFGLYNGNSTTLPASSGMLTKDGTPVSASCPTTAHWQAVKKIFLFLKGTRDYYLKFEKAASAEFICKGVSDASWAAGFDLRSYGGFTFVLGNFGYASSVRPQVSYHPWKQKQFFYRHALKKECG